MLPFESRNSLGPSDLGPPRRSFLDAASWSGPCLPTQSAGGLCAIGRVEVMANLTGRLRVVPFHEHQALGCELFAQQRKRCTESRHVGTGVCGDSATTHSFLDGARLLDIVSSSSPSFLLPNHVLWPISETVSGGWRWHVSHRQEFLLATGSRVPLP